jgi:hypothetical protein
MAELTDVELLSLLEASISPALVRPDEISLAQLHATLAGLEAGTEVTSITHSVRDSGSDRAGHVARRRRTRRSSIVVVSAISFALTAGVAAAAVVTNTLPGPTRAFAYDLGLPVTSPSLFRADQSATQLHQAIIANNRPEERALAQKLIGELKKLNFNDLTQIRARADKLLVDVGLGLPTLPSLTKTPITTTNTVPTVFVPSVTVPGTSTPSVSTPSVTTPNVSVPGVTVPSVSIPSVTEPTTGVPSLTIPRITLPKVTVSPITIPRVALP